MKKPNILLFRKLSKLEWDARRYRQGTEEMCEIYREQGIDPDRILDSHKRQKESFALIEDAVRTRYNAVPTTQDSGRLIDGDQACRHALRMADIVIASVGDELATSVAREMHNGKLLAINADPLTSEGALLWPSAETFIAELDKFPDDLPVEHWPRIQVKVDGKHLGDSIGDVYVGARERRQISKYSVKLNDGPAERQESSGLIVCTGAGSTGWFRSAYWTRFSESYEQINPPGAVYVVTEPYRGKLTSYATTRGKLLPGQQIKVQSLMPDGMIAIDSHTTLRFDRELEATIIAEANSIKVLTQNYKGIAHSEVYLGSRLRQLISRFVVTFPDNSAEEQKSSGLLVATSEGAPDWLIPASFTLGTKHNTECIFERQESRFKFLVTEPASRRYKITRGELQPNDCLIIVSHMPEGGIVSLDSYQNGVYSSGSVVELRFSPTPLQVIMPPK